ncbi:MAG: hypothetical protein QOI16_1594 [Pseudonocardiales bacterium]|nr:hypothetical protein [Pseudonocardiales bacterium]
MEPQLRQPGGSGTGTPFTPFAVERAAAKAAAKAAASEEATNAEAEAVDEGAETSRPADFRKGARRNHRPDPPAVKPTK